MGGKTPLSKYGVDIEAVDNDGKTALHRAAMFSDTEKVGTAEDSRALAAIDGCPAMSDMMRLLLRVTSAGNVHRQTRSIVQTACCSLVLEARGRG